jgi:hypothetical protein
MAYLKEMSLDNMSGASSGFEIFNAAFASVFFPEAQPAL